MKLEFRRTLVLALLVFLLADFLIFRLPAYRRLVEPESSSGMFWNSVKWENKRPPSGLQDVIVLGDSRISEGFSAKIADEEGKAKGFKFINAGVPSSTLRNWYYYLREVDPRSDRYRAVVLPFIDYADTPDETGVGRFFLDLHVMVSVLRESDIPELLGEVSTGLDKIYAARDMSLLGLIYRNDLQDFLSHPFLRYRNLNARRGQGYMFSYEYGGREYSIADVRVDAQGKRVLSPLVLSPLFISNLEKWLEPAKVDVKETSYRRHWLGKIIDRYRNSKTRLIGVRIPSNPFGEEQVRAANPLGALGEFESSGGISLLKADTFLELEHPKYFFDYYHLNHDGRVGLSRKLVPAIEALLSQEGLGR